jgi:Tol biopolymer transport system component
MNLHTFKHLYYLISITILLISCQSQSEQNLIAYTTDDLQVKVVKDDGSKIRQAVDTDLSESNLQWSPDGTQMSFTVTTDTGQSSIWIANVDGSMPRQVSETFDSSRATWLNNDILITQVITKTGEHHSQWFDANYILDLRDRSMHLYSEGPEDVVPFPSGDRWLARNGNKEGLIFYNLDDTSQSIFTEFVIDPHNFDISPTGEALVFCSSSLENGKIVSNVYKSEVQGNNVVKPEFIYSMDGCVAAHWSPKEEIIGLLDSQHTLHLFDVVTSSIVKGFEIGPLVTDNFIWSPDGKFVAVSKHDDQSETRVRELAKVNIETGEVTELIKNEDFERITDWRIVSQ